MGHRAVIGLSPSSFDDQGSQYDAKGILPMVDPADVATFRRRDAVEHLEYRFFRASYSGRVPLGGKSATAVPDRYYAF